MAEIEFELRCGDSVISAAVTVPDAPVRPLDLLPVLQKFDDGFIATWVGETEVSCRAGCGACCRQAVPISETEAFSLARVIERMPEERRARVLRRFAETVAALGAAGMRDRLAPGPLSKAEQVRLALDYFALRLACPFLEEESCGIHADRPLSCREYLVTSPAVNCANPSPETIRMVPLPVKFSAILQRFGDGKGEAAARWMPLPLLLEFVAGHAAEEEVELPGAEMFQNFFRQVAE